MLGCVQRCPRRWVQTPLLGVSVWVCACHHLVTVTLSLFLSLRVFCSCALSPFLSLSLFVYLYRPHPALNLLSRISLYLCLSSLPPSISRSLSLVPPSLPPAIYISTSRLDMCCFNSCAEVEILRAMRSGKQSELTRRRFAIP